MQLSGASWTYNGRWSPSWMSWYRGFQVFDSLFWLVAEWRLADLQPMPEAKTDKTEMCSTNYFVIIYFTQLLLSPGSGLCATLHVDGPVPLYLFGRSSSAE